MLVVTNEQILLYTVVVSFSLSFTCVAIYLLLTALKFSAIRHHVASNKLERLIY